MVENDEKALRMGLRLFHVEPADNTVKQSFKAKSGKDARKTLAAIRHQSDPIDFVQFQKRLPGTRLRPDKWSKGIV
jgi:DNA topoisomerase IB